MINSKYQQNVAVVGASGFLGQHLIQRLLLQPNYRIRAISHRPHEYDVSPAQHERFETITASVLDEEATLRALDQVDVAFYFVHLMGQTKDFYEYESIAAQRFAASCKANGVKRVIFMGGLGSDQEQLSEHLLSRHNTGTVLREILPLVIEFRASMIIGKGSVAFDILYNLVHTLPIMTLPRWSTSLTQPIALSDVLDYLEAAITLPVSKNEIIEIGGQQVLSYQDLYTRYAHIIGRNPLIVRLPFFPEWLGGWGLNLFTSRKHAKIGRIMVHSLSNSMIVTHPNDAKRLFPDISPKSLVDALNEASLV